MTDARGGCATEQPITVVHVEDNPAFADIVRQYLEREEEGGEGKQAFEVVSTGDPTDAVGELEAREVDCVVSDFDMPGTDGLALARSVRDEHPDLPFVLFTGATSEELTRRALGAGVTEVVRKGLADSLGVLADRIRTSVDRYRIERPAARDGGGTDPEEPELRLQNAHALREPAREIGDDEPPDAADAPLAKSNETRRDRADREGGEHTEAPVESDAIRSRLDDAWSARDAGEASPPAVPDTRFRVDERRLRRLFANMESGATNRGAEIVAASPRPLPDGIYLEKGRDGPSGAERRLAIEPAGRDSGKSTGIGLDRIRQIAVEYGWRTRVTTGTDDRCRIEFELRDRPLPHPR